jgi:hypothetical protein
MPDTEDIETVVNITQRVNIFKIEIIKQNKVVLSIEKKDAMDGSLNKSVHKYVDICYMAFNNKPYNAQHLIPNSEVRVLVMSGNSTTELFYGFIEKFERQWDKKKGIDAIHLVAISFAALLSQRMIQDFDIKFKFGLGEVIKKLIEPESIFDIQGIKCEDDVGSVYFDNVSKLDAIRMLAHIRKWCLKFEGKKVLFGPCKKPSRTGVTLNMADIESGTMRYGKDISDYVA